MYVIAPMFEGINQLQIHGFHSMGLLQIVTEPFGHLRCPSLFLVPQLYRLHQMELKYPSQSLCLKFQELHERNPEQLNLHFEVVVNQK